MKVSGSRRWLPLVVSGALLLPGCSSSTSETSPSTTAAPPVSIAGRPTLNHTVCATFPPDTFAETLQQKIVDVDTEDGSGQVAGVSYGSATCTFHLDAGGKVVLRALFKPHSTDPLGAQESITIRMAEGATQEGGVDKPWFIAKGMLASQVYVLDERRLYTVEATVNDVSVPEDTLVEVAFAALATRASHAD